MTEPHNDPEHPEFITHNAVPVTADQCGMPVTRDGMLLICNRPPGHEGLHSDRGQYGLRWDDEGVIG